MSKRELREHYKRVRASLSDERRQKASALALRFLSDWVDDRLKGLPLPKEAKKQCLSFAPFKDELDIWPFNHHLLLRGVLALPRVEKERLKIYSVASMDALIPSPLGILEPDPAQCEELEPRGLFAAIIPALAIDAKLHRLGFGKGYYDRLLHTFPKDVALIGVAFKEQGHPEEFDKEPHDIPLTHRFFF